ncbi:MAG: apiosidase-like domain-containing protein, partial [Thermoguttaceae bacterium]
MNTTKRLLGIHPGPPLWFHDAPYEALGDYSAVDVYYGMGGHGGGDEYSQVVRALKTMEKWRENNPGKLSIVGELCWEGMYGGNCGPFAQRIQFWGAVLGGAPGHCYGADALWQMNSHDRPFGESASGFTWGNWPWEEAMHWPGSRHVSVGKRILEKFEWWRFEPHPEWLAATIEKDDLALIAAAAGIPGELRVFYFAKKTRQRLLKLEPGVKYTATFISPLDGREYPFPEPVEADAEGSCDVPRRPINQDWVLVLTQ